MVELSSRQVVTVESLQRELEQVRGEVATLKRVLGTAISWIGHSAGTPLSQRETALLLSMLPPEK